MGEKVVAGGFDLSDRQRYRRKLQQCLAGLERLLAEKRFDRPKNLMGLEIELNLAGADGLPRMMNAEVLERIASRDFQTELGMFNLEVNIVPHRLGGRVLDQLAEELRTGLGICPPEGARGRRRDRDDRNSADARPATTWSPRTSRTSTATRCSTTRSWRRAARTSRSTSTAWSG